MVRGDPSGRMVAVAVTLLLATVGPAHAASEGPAPVGRWLTEDRNGVVAFEPCGQSLCARIVGMVIDHPADPTPVDHAGRSECGLPIITDAAETEPGLWSGHITDPWNGDVYRAHVWVDDRGRLHLRGYILIPLLGLTQIWTRYDAAVPADCRLTATDATGQSNPGQETRAVAQAIAARLPVAGVVEP